MSILLKGLIFLAFFSILHFSLDLSGWAWLKPFAGINESVFQHFKMAFWAYLLASLVEYPFFKKKRKPIRVSGTRDFWRPFLFPGLFFWFIFWDRQREGNSAAQPWNLPGPFSFHISRDWPAG